MAKTILRDVVFGFLVFCLLSLSLFHFSFGLFEMNNVAYNETEIAGLREEISNITENEIKGLGEDIATQTEKKEQVLDEEEKMDIYGTFLDILKFPFKLIKTIPNLITIIANVFYLPKWFLWIIVTAIFLLLAFAFISGFLRRDI
mgnify:CR=1 FL=1